MTEELPDGWAWAKIGDICEVSPRRFDSPPEEDEHLSFVPMASVEAGTGRLDASQTKAFGEVKKKSLTPFQENDVIFSKITPCMENGKIAIAEGLHGGRAVGSTEFMVLRCGDRISPRYLMYFLLQPSFRNEAERNMAGAVGHRRVPKAFISDFKIPIPPMGEQRRIIAALESELSRLDSASGILAESTRRTSLLLSSAAQRSVRGSIQLVDDASVGDSVDLEGLIELRKKMAAKKKPPIPPFGDLDFQLPPGWRMASIGQLAWSVEYGTSLKSSDSRSDGDVPVLRMGNIQGGKIDPGKLKYLPRLPEVESLILENGDFLFNRTNSSELVGKSAVYRGELGVATYASYLIRCRFVPGVDPDWISLVVNSAFGRSYISKVVSQQVGQANVNGTKLAAFPIPLPSLREQREILGVYQTWVSSVERLKSGLRAAQSQALAMRRSLLASAFTGRLVPQDPSDEPASELLSRIRAEQTGAPKTKRGPRAKSSPSPNSPVPTPEDSRPVPAGEQTVLEF